MASDGHVVQRVVESEREPYHQQRGADLDLIQPAKQMLRGEGAENRGAGERRTFEFDRRHVDLARWIKTLAPETLAIPVKWNRKPGGSGHIGRVSVQFDLDAVREMLARLVDHHMPAGHQKQAPIALKEEPAGIGQWPLSVKSADTRGGESLYEKKVVEKNLEKCLPG